MNVSSGPVVAVLGIALLLATAGAVVVLADGPGVPGTAGVSDATATPTASAGAAGAATATPGTTAGPTTTATAATPTADAPAIPTEAAATPTPVPPTETATAAPATETATRTATPAPATQTPTATPTPAPSSETSRHTVNATVPDDVDASGERYAAAEVDYGAATGGDAPAVSEVRAGVDHRDEHYRDEYGGGDAPAARVDENLTVTDVETRDGVLRVTFAEEVDLRPEDELVLVVTGDTPAADTVPVTIEGTNVTVDVEGTVTEHQDGSDSANDTATPTGDEQRRLEPMCP